MEEEKFSSVGTDKELSNSDESKASLDSSVERQKATQLSSTLRNLQAESDRIDQKVVEHWRNAKQHEAEGRLAMALEEKALYDDEVKRYKGLKTQIIDTEKQLDQLMSLRKAKATQLPLNEENA